MSCKMAIGFLMLVNLLNGNDSRDVKKEELMSETTLEPCFCGEKYVRSIRIPYKHSRDDGYIMRCPKCKREGPCASDVGRAIVCWNESVLNEHESILQREEDLEAAKNEQLKGIT